MQSRLTSANTSFPKASLLWSGLSSATRGTHSGSDEACSNIGWQRLCGSQFKTVKQHAEMITGPRVYRVRCWNCDWVVICCSMTPNSTAWQSFIWDPRNWMNGLYTRMAIRVFSSDFKLIFRLLSSFYPTTKPYFPTLYFRSLLPRVPQQTRRRQLTPLLKAAARLGSVVWKTPLR